MSDGNKRYLGDVFINSENDEYQRQFFKDIIESYQYQYNGDFNASKLQNYTANDFVKVGEVYTIGQALPIGIKLGNTPISDIVDGPQYIFTDAIKVDVESLNQEIREWYSLPSSNSNNNNKDLTAILVELHDQIIAAKNEVEGIHNTFLDQDYEVFKDTVSNFLGENSGQTYLNASCINGITLIPITQSDYNSLPSSVKNYWRYNFIINDSVPFTFEDISSIEASSDPNVPDFRNLHQFRINNGYIEVNDGFGNDWRQILPISDILEGAGSPIKNVIETDDFIINEESLENSLANIDSIDSTRQYPFILSSSYEDFIQTILINNSSNYITESYTANGEKKVNLNLNSLINTKISPLSTSINNINSDILSEKNRLDLALYDINEIKDNITSIIKKANTNEENIRKANTNISTTQNTLTQVNARLSDLGNLEDWEQFLMPQLHHIDKSVTPAKDYVSRCILNRKLKLCYVYLSFDFYVNKNDFGKRIEGVRLQSNTISKITLPVKPWSSSSMQSSSYNVWDNVRINDLGEIQMFSNRDKMPSSQPLHYLGSWMFLWDPVQDSSFASSNSIGGSPFEETE